MRDWKKMLSKKIVAALTVVTVCGGVAVPTQAATVKTIFTQNKTTYGIRTECTSFPGEVTAWAKVTNGSRKSYREKTGNHNASVEASLSRCTGTITRSGGSK